MTYSNGHVAGAAALFISVAVAGCLDCARAAPRTAPPAAEAAGTCRNLTTRQERADCRKLVREARERRAKSAPRAGRAASVARDRMAVGSASAPIPAVPASAPRSAPDP